MEYFGKHTRRTQPHSQRNKYKICTSCNYIVFTHRYICSENRCQLCSVRASEDYILDILQKASKSPGLKHFFKKILYDYL